MHVVDSREVMLVNLMLNWGKEFRRLNSLLSNKMAAKTLLARSLDTFSREVLMHNQLTLGLRRARVATKGTMARAFEIIKPGVSDAVDTITVIAQIEIVTNDQEVVAIVIIDVTVVGIIILIVEAIDVNNHNDLRLLTQMVRYMITFQNLSSLVSPIRRKPNGY